MGRMDPVTHTGDSPRDCANEERPGVATAASDRRSTSEAGSVASGHGADEIAAEGTQMAPKPSALFANLDLGDLLSRSGLDDVLKIGDLPVRHEHAGRCQPQLASDESRPFAAPSMYSRCCDAISRNARAAAAGSVGLVRFRSVTPDYRPRGNTF